jgi:antitoxin component YwqK of YwqJK toxin-antitoxin module
MFEGNVRDSKRVGYGILYHENGAVKYSGNFKSNNIHGKGIKIFHDNATLGFEGDIIEGRKENFGRLWHK